MDICIFKRTEKKYRITEFEKNILLQKIGTQLIADSHGKSTVCSLYLDTPDFLIIRNSIEAKIYKEKLRVRCYGIPTEQSKVFFEIKKKFKGVVYKRRVAMTLDQAKTYITGGSAPVKSQIMDEIDYAMRFYGFPVPKMLIAYEREAYFVKDQPDLRITFDHNLRYRKDDLLPENGCRGNSILADNEYIMEIKAANNMPFWLSRALDECGIMPSSFSKYGTAYNLTLKAPVNEGEREYVLV